MGVAIYIVAEEEIDGLDIFVNGRTIGQIDEHEIADLCELLGLRSLLSFISQRSEDTADIFDDTDFDGDLNVVDVEMQWFEAKEGLEVLARLIEHLEEDVEALSEGDAVLEDLREYEAVLATLDAHHVRWRFAIDI